MATARRSASTSRAAAGAGSSGFHGAAGRRKMQEEDEKAAARREAATMNSNIPFRFFCTVGETREVIVVDEEPNFFRYEHNLKDTRTGRYSIFCSCINESAHCPVCKAVDRPSYFAMYLTVIDLTPYESEKHGIVEWSKKLMVVKSAQQKKITRLWERHGTLRGMVLSMTRDGEKDAAIGNDIEFVEFVEEDELLTYETSYETEKDGKKTTKEIIGHEACDYDALFPQSTEQQLRAIVGGRPEPGSRDEADEAMGGRSRRRGSEFDTPEAPPARTRLAGRSAPREEEPERQAPPSSRRFASRAAPAEEPAPPARGAAPRRAARAEPEEERDEEDVPQRNVARARTALPARRRAEPEERADEAPPRSSASLADRRRALRG